MNGWLWLWHGTGKVTMSEGTLEGLKGVLVEIVPLPDKTRDSDSDSWPGPLYDVAENSSGRDGR